MVERKEGSGHFGVGLVVGSTGCLVRIDDRKGISGISFVDGQGADVNETKCEGQRLYLWTQYRIEYTVRKPLQDNMNITVQVDGKKIINWTGTRSRLSPSDSKGPHAVVKAGKDRFPWLQSGNKSSFAVSKLELRPIGKPIPSVAASSTKGSGFSNPVVSQPFVSPIPAEAGVVNLLEKIDPARDTIQGTRTLEGTTLVSSSNRSIVTIPYPPPEEYTLSAVVERRDGTNSFGVGLVFASTACVVFIDSDAVSGLNNIDGVNFKKNETTTQGHLLDQGKQYTIKCSVRKVGQNDVKIVVHVGGKRSSIGQANLIVPRWARKFTHPVVEAGKEHYLWLQSGYGSAFAVSKLELLPIGAVAAKTFTGTSTLDNSSVFVGQWDCGDVVITLYLDFTAHKDRLNPLGKWECVNGEARIVWDDGWQTVLRRDGEGFQKLTWKAGASLYSPTSNTCPAVKVSAVPPAPTPQPAVKWRTTGEYPRIAGEWWEAKKQDIFVTVHQNGTKISAFCTYTKDGVKVHWNAYGTISTNGQIEMHIVHTTPKGYLPQTRTGQLDPGGTRVRGHATFQGGGHDFTWRLKEPQ